MPTGLAQSDQGVLVGYIAITIQQNIEAALVSELLEGLPYQSRIMSVTEDDWLRMSISEQASIISSLADKIELYARFNESTDQWVDYLGTGGGADALLYPMRLDDLP